MDFTEGVLRHAARCATGTAAISYGGKPVALDQPFARLTVRDSLVKYAGMNEADAGDTVALHAKLKSLGHEPPAHWTLAGAAVRRVRGGGRRAALAADLHPRLPGRGVAARTRLRHEPGHHRTFRALHHRARIRERLL